MQFHILEQNLYLDTMGLSPDSLKSFLEINCEMKENICINKTTGKSMYFYAYFWTSL
jgi:hypothetical protein